MKAGSFAPAEGSNASLKESCRAQHFAFAQDDKEKKTAGVGIAATIQHLAACADD
jgi:hypothetical protein